MTKSLSFRFAFRCALAAFALLLPALPVIAASSAWVEAEGGRMRLLALAPAKDGSVEAALQIEPKAGWVTYWREPGNAGIPPQITPHPASGLLIDGIGYPTPKHIVNGDIDEIGYDGPVALPFSVSPIKKGSFIRAVAVDVFIGLCRDICIPFQANFELPLMSSRADASDQLIIEAAKASLPRAPSEAFSLGEHALSADMSQLFLDLTLPSEDGPPPQIIIAGPSGYVFTRLAAFERRGRTFSATVAIGRLPKNYTASGKTWTLLAVAGNQAIEAPLAFP